MAGVILQSPSSHPWVMGVIAPVQTPCGTCLAFNTSSFRFEFVSPIDGGLLRSPWAPEIFSVDAQPTSLRSAICVAPVAGYRGGAASQHHSDLMLIPLARHIIAVRPDGWCAYRSNACVAGGSFAPPECVRRWEAMKRVGAAVYCCSDNLRCIAAFSDSEKDIRQRWIRVDVEFDAPSAVAVSSARVALTFKGVPCVFIYEFDAGVVTEPTSVLDCPANSSALGLLHDAIVVGCGDGRICVLRGGAMTFVTLPTIMSSIASPVVALLIVEGQPDRICVVSERADCAVVDCVSWRPTHVHLPPRSSRRVKYSHSACGVAYGVTRILIAVESPDAVWGFEIILPHRGALPRLHISGSVPMAECPAALKSSADAEGGFGVFGVSASLCGACVSMDKLDSSIGHGSFGQVWLRRNAAGHLVACKSAASLEAQHALANEGRTVASLPPHPHVLGYSQSHHELHSQFQTAGSLEELCFGASVRVPVREVMLRSWLAQALLGLDHLHRNGVLHRDVKPSNILASWRADGSLQLRWADFGTSTGAPRAHGLTVRGTVVGTPAFAAPEVLGHLLAGGSDVPSTAAGDVWGLGAIFYFIICGASSKIIERTVSFKRVLQGLPPLAVNASVQASSQYSLSFCALVDSMMYVDRHQRISCASALESLAAISSTGPFLQTRLPLFVAPAVWTLQGATAAYKAELTSYATRGETHCAWHRSALFVSSRSRANALPELCRRLETWDSSTWIAPQIVSRGSSPQSDCSGEDACCAWVEYVVPAGSVPAGEWLDSSATREEALLRLESLTTALSQVAGASKTGIALPSMALWNVFVLASPGQRTQFTLGYIWDPCRVAVAGNECVHAFRDPAFGGWASSLGPPFLSVALAADSLYAAHRALGSVCSPQSIFASLIASSELASDSESALH